MDTELETFNDLTATWPAPSPLDVQQTCKTMVADFNGLDRGGIKEWTALLAGNEPYTSPLLPALDRDRFESECPTIVEQIDAAWQALKAALAGRLLGDQLLAVSNYIDSHPDAPLARFLSLWLRYSGHQLWLIIRRAGQDRDDINHRRPAFVMPKPTDAVSALAKEPA